MKKVTCFEITESPFNPGKWVISPVSDALLLKYTEGSFNIICARMLSLSYAQYLRFCRDCCGAEIVGKGHKYPVAYFSRDERVQALCRLLNSRANLVLWNREHPNWEEHQVELAKWKVNHGVFDKADS